MILMTVVVLVGALFPPLAAGDAPPAGLTSPYLIPPLARGGTQFLVLHGEFQANYTVSRTRCVSLGGELADVDSLELLHYLTSHLHRPAFVLGFLGDSFGKDCAAIYPGAAVAIPEMSCSETLDSICEVPVLGTASIDPSVPNILVSEENRSPMAVKDVHTVPHGFFRLMGQVRQDAVIATVNIVGPVATNPFLPCCRCHG